MRKKNAPAGLYNDVYGDFRGGREKLGKNLSEKKVSQGFFFEKSSFSCQKNAFLLTREPPEAARAHACTHAHGYTDAKSKIDEVGRNGHGWPHLYDSDADTDADAQMHDLTDVLGAKWPRKVFTD